VSHVIQYTSLYKMMYKNTLFSNTMYKIRHLRTGCRRRVFFRGSFSLSTRVERKCVLECSVFVFKFFFFFLVFFMLHLPFCLLRIQSVTANLIAQVHRGLSILMIQGGSNMTGIICV
jgi:hypothetical protein